MKHFQLSNKNIIVTVSILFHVFTMLSSTRRSPRWCRWLQLRLTPLIYCWATTHCCHVCSEHCSRLCLLLRWRLSTSPWEWQRSRLVQVLTYISCTSLRYCKHFYIVILLLICYYITYWMMICRQAVKLLPKHDSVKPVLSFILRKFHFFITELIK